jgi:hypothetical protein
VSTAVASPRSEIGEAPVPRRRRWPLILALFLTLILVSGLIAWQVVGRTYEPLRSAFFGMGGAARAGKALIYRDGGRFWVRFDVFNGGRWPLEIRGVRFHVLEDAPARQVSVQMTPRIDYCCGRLVPFEPFRLGPDEHRILIVRLRFIGCGIVGRNDRYGLGDPTMIFRFLGFERAITYRLRGRVLITGPPIGCPR